MPSANRCWATQPIELEDSSDETLLDESAGVHIINDRTDATPDILEDEADPDDDDILIFDGAALDRVEHLPTAAPQPHALPAGSRILVHHGLFGNVNLTSGVNVALVDGDFFRIKYVVKDIYTQCESMHGWRLRRACRVQDRLPKLAGELCLLVTAPIGDTRSDWERGLEELSLEKIDFGAFRWMREIAFTNQEEPAFRDGIGHDRDERRRIITEGRLVCRRKHVVLYAPGNTKLGIKPVEQCIEWLRREEADEGLGIWDEAKILAAGKARDVESVRRNFHPQAKEGIISRLSDPTSRPMKRIKRREGDEGDVQVLDELAFQEAMRRHKQIRTNSDQHSPKRQSHKRILQYQAADMCCGGGGASGGIAETNFKVVWGLDKDLAAARAWSLNWPSATTYHMDIGDFVKYEIDRCAYAHAIHFSFSCKAWSKANPYKGDFEHNPDDIATTLAAPDLLRLLRPRLATFENADAFQTIRKHRDYFNTFLKSIVDMGYNVRWRIVDLARYGNPQHRQRLIVIASCSGETLPEFPPPTHGPEPGLRPFRTVREAIQGAIDPRDPLHNKTEMRLKWRDRPRRNMLPADWDEVLPHGLTTGGPTDIHPSGRREFTVRETMELQRFRPEHKLPGDLCLGKKREIVGNAVPRDIIRLIYKDFYDVLRATDQKIEKYRNVNLDGDDQASFPHTVPARASVGSRAKRKARASPSDSVTLCDSDEEMTDALASSPAIHTEPRKKVTMSQHSMIRSSGFPTAPTFKQEAGREPSGPGSFTAHRRPRKEQHGTIQSWNAKAKARAMSESEDELPDLPTFSGTPRRPRKKPRTMDDGFGVPKASASTSTPTPTPTPTPQGRAARPSWSAVVVDLTDD